MKDNPSVPRARPPVVVVGASAGGLEALSEMLAGVEETSKAAYVVVQHLAPDQKSVLHELLQTHCAVPVTQISQNACIERAHVYVVPPGQLVAIGNGELHLTARAQSNQLQRPIDHCLESLAQTMGRDGHCVILSGTGSDGAAGLRAVKTAGGVAIAQESETARFPGMPDAAVATGMIDFVLPGRRIVARIEEIICHRLAVDDEAQREKIRARIEEVLPRITRALKSATGHDFSAYKPGTMVRRIERRMTLMRMSDVTRFCVLMEENGDEATLLGQEFLIGVTEFFRDAEAFAEVARRVVDPLLDRDAASIRVWVPGCSTGEEAYSLAILFLEAMKRRGIRRTLQVFGTDIDSHALLAARHGAFPASALAGVSPERLERFFTPEGEQFRARGVLRECCVFAPHNMVQDPPFSRLDLISCRNLMIYLSSDLQKQVLPRFHFSLKPSGFLFLGPSEGLSGEERLFDTVDKTHRIFRRNDDAEPSYSSLADPVPRIRETRSLGMGLGPQGGEGPQLANREVIAEREFLRRHAAPFAVLSRAGEVRYLSHRMTDFARPSQGTPSNQIDTFLSPELRVPVRSALAGADDSGAPYDIPGVFVGQAEGGPRMFDVSVSPLRPGGDEYLLVLSEVRATDARDIDAAVGERDAADRDILETENVSLRRQLTETLQEYETSGQELKSTNEELMSMNEELQSSNEELETSREELQSINEELETVNAELRENNRQLVRANSDLKNLFESTDLAVLFLDRAFGVRNFTPATTALYGIRPRDIGRPIFDLSSRIDYPEFRADAERVDATLQPVDREVRITATDETFLLRMKPYRTTDDRIDGYVLSFVDISHRKRNEEMLERNRQDLARQYAELENLYDTTPVGLALISRDMGFLRINETLARIDGNEVADYQGRTIPEIMPEVAKTVVPIYESVFRTGEPRLSVEISLPLPEPGSEMRFFIGDFYPVFVDDNVYAVGVCVREVTDERRLMDELAESERRMKRMFDATPVYICITTGPSHVFAYSNPANEAVAGGRELVGRSLAQAFPELEGQGVFERFDETFRSGSRQLFPEFRLMLEDGEGGEPSELWLSQVLEPVRDGSGEVTGVISFAYEITEQVKARKAAQDSESKKTLLLAELQHRVKNSLATVRAVSRFLLAGSEDPETFHKRLSDRLGAMSRTHDLLTDADWVSTELADLIATEAAPYQKERDSRVRVTGATVRLDSKEALAFGMAVHELMTNAAKYGALSNDTGRIEVTTSRDGDRRKVVWKETGGPPVRDPGTDRGFGSVVIEKVLVSDVRAEVEVRFESDGLLFEAVF